MAAQATKPKPKMGRPKTDRNLRAKAMKAQGLTEREIASALNLPKTTVHDILSKQINPLELDDYKTHRADIYATKAKQFVQILDHEAAKTMMAKQPAAAALWFNSLANNERLERGQATIIADVQIRGLAALIDATPRVVEQENAIDIE